MVTSRDTRTLYKMALCVWTYCAFMYSIRSAQHVFCDSNACITVHLERSPATLWQPSLSQCPVCHPFTALVFVPDNYPPSNIMPGSPASLSSSITSTVPSMSFAIHTITNDLSSLNCKLLLNCSSSDNNMEGDIFLNSTDHGVAGSNPGTSTNFKCGLGLERGPPSLVRTIG